MADPKTVADLFADHSSSVSRRNPTAPGARHRQDLEAVDVDFASPGGESYNVPLSPGELMAALSQCYDSSPGSDDIPYAFLRHMSDIVFNFYWVFTILFGVPVIFLFVECGRSEAWKGSFTSH